MRRLGLAVLVLVLGFVVAACGDDGSAPSSAPGSFDSPVPGRSAPRFTLHGPFATARRANEVCNQFLRLGYDAIYYHSGDGYYVKVKH